MFFFVKKSKIVMDTFTHWEHVYKHSPIVEARKRVPKWLTSMEGKYLIKDLYPQATIKICPAIQDYNLKGLIIPLWSDLAIKIEDKILSWQFADMITENDPHPSRQWEPFRNHLDYVHMKLLSPWIIACKEDILWTWEKPYFHNALPKEIEVVAGIGEYKNQNTTNTNLFIDVRQDRRLNIELGAEIVRMLPLSEREVIVKNHLIDQSEWEKMARKMQPAKFVNHYRKYVKKCPFSSE